jgi:hypothetical protein
MDGSSCVRALTAGPTYRPNLPARIERSRNSFQLALATEGKKFGKDRIFSFAFAARACSLSSER